MPVSGQRSPTQEQQIARFVISIILSPFLFYATTLVLFGAQKTLEKPYSQLDTPISSAADKAVELLEASLAPFLASTRSAWNALRLAAMIILCIVGTILISGFAILAAVVLPILYVFKRQTVTWKIATIVIAALYIYELRESPRLNLYLGFSLVVIYVAWQIKKAMPLLRRLAWRLMLLTIGYFAFVLVAMGIWEWCDGGDGSARLSPIIDVMMARLIPQARLEIQQRLRGLFPASRSTAHGQVVAPEGGAPAADT